jgi:hypothetical protein
VSCSRHLEYVQQRTGEVRDAPRPEKGAQTPLSENHTIQGGEKKQD